MVYVLLLMLILLIGLSEIGLVALLVLPVTCAVIGGIVSFIALLAGVPGSGQMFLICALAIGGAVALIALINGSGY